MATLPRSAPPAPRAAAVPVWAGTCFLASGAAGLLYEVVWSKQISYLLGSSVRSGAVVVAAFLGGLALGARFLGAPLARAGSPARRYALLEGPAGLLRFCVLPVLRALDGPVGQLYRSLGGESTAFALARAALLFAVMVPPASLMGATLPVLVARCERGTVGPALAVLYALNTLGAVLGSLAGGFVLLPGVGLAGTALVAVGLNFLAAIWAAVTPEAATQPGGLPAASGQRPWPVPAPPGGARPLASLGGYRLPALLSRTSRRWLGLLFAASGFVALALQIAWFRLYGLTLGSSVYSFSAVLGVDLAGLALGSALASRWIARARGPGSFGLLELGLAASVALGAHLYAGLPGAMLELGQRT